MSLVTKFIDYVNTLIYNFLDRHVYAYLITDSIDGHISDELRQSHLDDVLSYSVVEYGHEPGIQFKYDVVFCKKCHMVLTYRNSLIGGLEGGYNTECLE